MEPENGFEWDENKRLSNLKKHGIDFADATAVFDDVTLCLRRSRNSGDEERYISIGMLQGKLIAVIFTVRRNKRRIISARVARRREREQYDQEKEKTTK